jgi:hypothetical protein
MKEREKTPWLHVFNRTGPGRYGTRPADLEIGDTAGWETCGTSSALTVLINEASCRRVQKR